MKHLITLLISITICTACFSQSKKSDTSKKVIPVSQPKLTDSTDVGIVMKWAEWQKIFSLLRISEGASGAELERTIQYMQSRGQIIPKK